MQVAIGTLHYPPSSAPNAPIVSGLAKGLSARGHDVVVYSGTAGSATWAEGPRTVEVQYTRVERKERPERVRGYLSFARALGRGLDESGADVGILFTPPPLMPLFVRRSIPIVYSIQDLYPEVMRFSTLPMARVLAACVGPLEAVAQRRAARCVVLGSRVGAIVGRRVPADRIIVIPNPLVFPDKQDVEAVVKWEDLIGPGGPVVIYAGNVGQSLDWELVLASASYLADARVRVVIVGEGAKARWLDEQIAARHISNVWRFPPWPAHLVHALLSSATVGLIPLRPLLALCAYPSKAATYMSAGLPVVATAERASDLADLLTTTGAGRPVPLGDVTAFADAVLGYVNDPAERAAAANRGRRYVQEELGLDLAVDRYADACAALLDPAPS